MTALPNQMKTVQLVVCTSYTGIFLGCFFLFSNFEEQWVIKISKSVDEKLCIKSFSKLPSEINFLELTKGTPHKETTAIKT